MMETLVVKRLTEKCNITTTLKRNHMLHFYGWSDFLWQLINLAKKEIVIGYLNTFIMNMELPIQSVVNLKNLRKNIIWQAIAP